MSVHVVDDVVDGLEHVLKVGLRLRYCVLLRAVRQDSIRLVLHGHPALEWWYDALVDKELDRCRLCVPQPFNEAKLAELAHRVDEVLHLVHHDLARIVISV